MVLNYIWIAFFIISSLFEKLFPGLSKGHHLCGSIGIKNTQFSLGHGLLDDITGFTTTILVAYCFFT